MRPNVSWPLKIAILRSLVDHLMVGTFGRFGDSEIRQLRITERRIVNKSKFQNLSFMISI